MLLLSGCHKLTNRRMFWETPPNTFVQAKSNSMPYNMFECILRNLLCDNDQLDK